VEQWNGTVWFVPSLQAVGSGTTQLASVSAVSPTDVWVAGLAGTPDRTLVERWDGTSWSVQKSLNPGRSAVLHGISADASDDAWAVGDFVDASGQHPLIERWDGARWLLYSATEPSGGVHRSRIARSLPTPGQLSKKPVHVLTNVLIALLLVVLLPIPAQLFNAAFKEHYEEIVMWRFPRALGLVPQSAPPPTGPQAPPPPRPLAGRALTFATYLAVTAFLSCFVEPNFGLNASGAALFLSMFLGLAVVTGVFGALESWYMRRRHSDHGFFRGYPAALLVVAAASLISRLAHFLPGFIIGAIAGFVFLKQLSARERGRRDAFGAIASFVLALVVWVVRTPVANAAAEPGASTLVIVVEAVMVAIVVSGIERTAFGMLPLRYLAGEDVRVWSRRGWMALAFLGTLAMIYILINPYGNVISPGAVGPLVALFCVAGGMSAFCVGFWWYFKRRDEERERAEAESEAPGR